MKFLCDNCKAKYQIPDEKISGRTLRMKCRKCDHDIIIRGDSAESQPKTVAPSAALSVPASVMPTAASALPAARSRASGTGVPPRATSSALGADFQRRVAAGAAEAPEPKPEVVQLWHVAINDVPVGPIRREELAKKIGTGEVNGESLCWREGFDDWRPVREVTDLASLLDQRRPPVIRTSGEHSVVEARNALAGVASQSSVSALDSFETPSESGDDEATIVGASPLLREMQEREEREKAERDRQQRATAAAAAAAKARADASVKVVTPKPAAPESVAPASDRPSTLSSLPPPAKRRKPLSPPVWIAIAGAVGFGMMMAFLLVDRVLAPRPPAVVQVQPAPQPAADPPPAPNLDLDTTDPGEVIGDPSNVAIAPTTPTERPAHPTNGQPTTRPATNATQTAQNLTPEQRALIERMGGQTGSEERSPSTNINVPGADNTTSAGVAHGPLSASDLGAVVNRNKIQLQRCHERALRGMSSAPAVRMDVTLRVSPAGSVSTASATGTDFGGLKACIEQTVRRWRFPESSGGGETRFPVVFQAIN